MTTRRRHRARAIGGLVGVERRQDRAYCRHAEDEGVFEVPRNTRLNLAKIGLGLVLLAAGLAPLCRFPELWPIAAPLLLAGAVLVAGSVRVLPGRPPLMRATSAGLWFGGGRIIPWHEVAAIYDARLRLEEQFGGTFQTRELSIAFHRRRALLAAPWSLWFTTLPLGRIATPLHTLDDPTAAVVVRLEAMWRRACGDEKGVAAGISKPPRARVIVR